MTSIETTVASFDVDHMRDSIMAVVAPTPSGPRDEDQISNILFDPNLMQFAVVVIIQPCQTR